MGLPPYFLYLLFKFIAIRASTYLYDGGIIGETSLKRRLGLGRVAHANVLEVAAAENYVLVNLVPGSHRPISRTVFGAERTN